jgi:hypothetical protein
MPPTSARRDAIAGAGVVPWCLEKSFSRPRARRCIEKRLFTGLKVLFSPTYEVIAWYAICAGLSVRSELNTRSGTKAFKEGAHGC